MLCFEKNCVFAKIFAVSPKILLRRQTFTKCCARLLGLHLYALCIASFSKHNKRIDELLLWDYKNLGFLAIHSLTVEAPETQIMSERALWSSDPKLSQLT